MQTPEPIKKYRTGLYLLDVLTLAATAFGGPQVHFTQIHKKMVIKRGYITEDDLKELNSLCTMLPGPTSTQTITAIGFMLGGPSLAFLTLAIWVLPASLIMGVFAFVVTRLSLENPRLDFLKYIQPMAVGFIIYAAYKIKDLFVTRIHHWVLMFLSAFAAIMISTPVVFPVLLLVGGMASTLLKRTDYMDVHPVKIGNWSNLILFFAVFLVSAGLGALTHNRAFLLFENTYRYGSIVFGGGHVLIPMMFTQFVEFKQYLTANEFLAGVGVLQAVPGPVFSFSSYTGAIILKNWGAWGMVLGSIIGTSAIFLPGILLIFFIYPIWNQIKVFSPVKNAIEGINATSAGLVLASAYLLFKPVEVNEMNMLVLLSTLFLLLTTKIPYPLVVICCIVAGIFF